jgi:hypothetical protein
MTMQIGVHYGSSTDFPSVLDDIVAYEGAGLDVAWLGESYGYDSPTALGALAARTSTIRLGPAILAVQTRSAALIAMTAACCAWVRLVQRSSKGYTIATLGRPWRTRVSSLNNAERSGRVSGLRRVGLRTVRSRTAG